MRKDGAVFQQITGMAGDAAAEKDAETLAAICGVALLALKAFPPDRVDEALVLGLEHMKLVINKATDCAGECND